MESSQNTGRACAGGRQIGAQTGPISPNDQGLIKGERGAGEKNDVWVRKKEPGGRWGKSGKERGGWCGGVSVC